eukprot:IDg22128t1
MARKKTARTSDEDEESSPNSSTSVRYAIKGKQLCRHGFMAIVQVAHATLQRHISEISPQLAAVPYVTKRGRNREDNYLHKRSLLLNFFAVLGSYTDYLAPAVVYCPTMMSAAIFQAAT